MWMLSSLSRSCAVGLTISCGTLPPSASPVQTIMTCCTSKIGSLSIERKRAINSYKWIVTLKNTFQQNWFITVTWLYNIKYVKTMCTNLSLFHKIPIEYKKDNCYPRSKGHRAVQASGPTGSIRLCSHSKAFETCEQRSAGCPNDLSQGNPTIVKKQWLLILMIVRFPW